MTPTPRLHACGFANKRDLITALIALTDGTGVPPVGVELLPISTCQRHELFILTSEPFKKPTKALRTYESADAALRLFQITAGVVSDVPGEEAVAHQVKHATREALRSRLAGPTIAKLVRRALRAGDSLRERVRRGTPILELPDLLVPLVSGRVILLGAGALGRAIAACGVTHIWATRTPRQPNQLTIDQALAQLRPGDTLISALANVREPYSINIKGVHTIDFGESPTIRRAAKPIHCHAWALRDVIEQSHNILAPQREAVTRAAHRLPALAEAALAETLCPQIKSLNRAIDSFRRRIVEAELNRLAPVLASCGEEAADVIRRSMKHAAARSTHPLHEYVNALGRLGRADDARLLVDHILGSRVGIQSGGTSGTGVPAVRKKGRSK